METILPCASRNGPSWSGAGFRLPPQSKGSRGRELVARARRDYQMGQGDSFTDRPASANLSRTNKYSMSFTQHFLEEVQQVTQQLDPNAIEKVVDVLAGVRERGGRLFILGVGGSAANASHAVNDFRKICGFECYAPTDNVSELTARTNDDGWATIFAEWLKGSRLGPKDGLLIFSVGGGNLEKNVSPNLVAAIQLANQVGASVVGVVGRDGGYTGKAANAAVIVPTVNPDHVTPHTEAFQAVVWHLLVSHPKLKVGKTKWESTR
jgi:D-sedoheptulose 7-phosphate isomerase